MATAIDPADNLATEADEVLVEAEMMVTVDLAEVGRTAVVTECSPMTTA